MKKNNYEKLTPAMRHYVETKEKNPDAFLFYRLGDFYELFFQDAIEVSDLLDLTLTKKSGGLDEKIPMCGVPFRVANQYIKRLVKLGYAVAICDQVEDPKTAKGLVKREITKIVTPGTFIDDEGTDGSNYLCSIALEGKLLEITYCDYPSGKLYMNRKIIWNDREAESFLEKSFALFNPIEILYERDFKYTPIIKKLMHRYHILKLNEIHGQDNSVLQNYPSLCQSIEYNSSSLANLLAFLEKVRFQKQNHLHLCSEQNQDLFMDLSETTIRNLELVENNHDRQKDQSIYELLDFCQTKMGSRGLRSRILHPFMKKSSIYLEYDRIDCLHGNRILFDDLRETLAKVYDIDRLAVYISNKTMTPKQIERLIKSLDAIYKIYQLLEVTENNTLLSFFYGADLLDDLTKRLSSILIDDPPANYQEQRFIAKGVDEELDRLFNLSESGKNWILELEEKERRVSGIKNLRIKYNKILGYFFEVSKSYVDQVPEYFIRKQTLVGSERFFTEELKNREEEILHANEKAFIRQMILLEQIRTLIESKLSSIQKLSEIIENLDITCSLATAADHYHYNRPHFNDSGILDIKGGRHPVVEQAIEEEYIPNDTYLDKDKVLLQIITGPNMAGKSTYMRQVALIQILAQIGSFVPAESSNLPIVDQIFTRIGASDFLTRGQSTFMVEMTEVAEILQLATEDSLILFDEVGRGTSTFDGLSIAWAIVEYIYKEVRAKTLFATHYFELTELEDQYEGILNVTVATEKVNSEIRFLRKIIVGQSNYSFGIDVAKLAGVKNEVIERAREVLTHLEARNDQISIQSLSQRNSVVEHQVDPIKEKIKSIDIDKTTPLEALMLLQSLKEEVDG